MKSKAPTLIAICGWALSGKNSIAKLVAEKLKIHWIDIDNVRLLSFGTPNPHPDISEETMQRDRAEMKASYELIYAAVSKNLGMGKCILITATFSRAVYWKEILDILEQNPEIQAKVISCEPQNDNEKEIQNRLKSRVFGHNAWSAVNSIERYEEVKSRYESPPLPHLKLDTSPPNTIQDCVEKAVAYIQS